LRGLIVLFLLLVSTYAVVTPPFEGFDSLAHYGYITYLRTYQRLPVLDRATAKYSYELIAQPPLYYTLAALASLGAPLDETVDLAAHSANPYQPKVLSKRLSVTLPNPSWRALWPIWIARGVAMFAGLLTVVGCWWLIRALFPRSPTLALAVTSLVAFNPQFLFTAISINTDIWSAAMNVLAIAVMTRQLAKPKVDRSWFWVGVWAGLATLAKYSGLLLGVPLGLLALVYLWRVGWRKALPAFGYALLGALLIAGGFYGRNLWLYGQVVPLRQMAVALPTLLRPHPFSWAHTLDFVPWLLAGYWGIFVSTIAPALYLDTTKAFMWVGAAGLLLWPWRRRSAAYSQDRLALGIALVWFALFAVSVLNWTRTIDFGEQGRLLLAASPALALLLVFGWQAWFPQRWHPWLHGAIALFSLGLAFSQISTLANAYAIPPAVAAPQPDRPLNVQFAGGMQLLGIDLPQGAALRPGRPLPVTLYFSTAQAIDGFYTLFLHLADEQNRLLFHVDGVPAQGHHPTRQWVPGAIFADHYLVTVTDPTYDGLATLSLGFYPIGDQSQRQHVTTAQGADLGDRVVLAQVRVHNRAQPAPPQGEPLARWQAGIQLQAAQVVTKTTQSTVTVQVLWHATQVQQQDYTVFAQLLSRDGQLLAQVDQHPQGGRHPTSTWQSGDVISDTYTLPPTTAPWGRLIIGLYDPQQQRLTLQGEQAGADFFVLAEQNHGQ
jgi:hypothetical protein